MFYKFILLMSSLPSMYCWIHYPVSRNLYAEFKEVHLSGSSYNRITAYVCNINNVYMCTRPYIGIGEDEATLHKFDNAISLLSLDTLNTTKEYNIPLLGLPENQIKFGVTEEYPFLIEIYKIHNEFQITIEYVIIFVLFILFCSSVYNSCFMRIKSILHNRKIMTSIPFNNESLLNTSCTICLDDFDENSKLVQLNECKHVFHKTCINDWLKQKPSCPNCQSVV